MQERPLFHHALAVVRAQAALRIRNGHWTERGLARRLNVSQAHIHNVLKGARGLTPDLADALLVVMEMDLEEVLIEAKVQLRQ
ncbi:MAG: helix-turn-helix transcriptional regulator [Bryobacteraceae bacterium]